MPIRQIIALGAAAASLSIFLGCCDTTGTGSTVSVNCPPPPAVSVSSPGLLPEKATCDSGLPIRSKSFPACGEVQGDLVYNLGAGALSNTSAVRLAGGNAPRAIRVSGGVKGFCNPVPPRYYETLRRNAQGLKTPPVAIPGLPADMPKSEARPAAPIAAVPAPAAPAEIDFDKALEPGLAAGGYCAPVVCPVLPGSAEVCKPGENLSECFTLTEEELNAGPAPFVPASAVTLPVPPAGVTEVAPQAAAPAPVKTPDAEPTVAVRKQPEAPALDKYLNVSKLEALAPPSDLDREAEKLADKTTEAKQETAEPAVAVPPLPPVPQLTDIDASLEDALSGKDYSASSLPEVELPPELN